MQIAIELWWHENNDVQMIAMTPAVWKDAALLVLVGLYVHVLRASLADTSFSCFNY